MSCPSAPPPPTTFLYCTTLLPPHGCFLCRKLRTQSLAARLNTQSPRIFSLLGPSRPSITSHFTPRLRRQHTHTLIRHWICWSCERKNVLHDITPERPIRVCHGEDCQYEFRMGGCVIGDDEVEAREKVKRFWRGAEGREERGEGKVEGEKRVEGVDCDYGYETRKVDWETVHRVQQENKYDEEKEENQIQKEIGTVGERGCMVDEARTWYDDHGDKDEGMVYGEDTGEWDFSDKIPEDVWRWMVDEVYSDEIEVEREGRDIGTARNEGEEEEEESSVMTNEEREKRRQEKRPVGAEIAVANHPSTLAWSGDGDEDVAMLDIDEQEVLTEGEIAAMKFEELLVLGYDEDDAWAITSAEFGVI